MQDNISKTVLIIDDDEATRFLFKLAVERVGCEVYTAANGQEGLECLAKIPKPFLIFLDLMMPVMDGWRFLEEIKDCPEWREIPVVACSAFAVQADVIKAEEVLAKPVDLQVLTQTVRRWRPGDSGETHDAPMIRET